MIYSRLNLRIHPSGFLAGKTITLLLTILLITILSSSFAQGTWSPKADFGGTDRAGASGFSIDNKGYIGTGNSLSGLKKDFWEYDVTTNTWTQKADYGGIARRDAVGFSIGSKGYIGTGYSFMGPYLSDFWEYDPSSNIWTNRASFGGGGRYLAVGFSIGTKGYIGTGANFNIFPYYKNDLWEYDPTTDSWIQKANLTATGRAYAVGFSLVGKGYIGTGYYASNLKDFWEYDPAADSWLQKADFGGTARRSATGFSIASEGYIGTGYDGIARNDFWAFDPSANTWTEKTSFGGPARFDAVGFSIETKGYIGTGESYSNDFWEYTIGCTTPTVSIIAVGATSICKPGSVLFNSTVTDASIYQWKKNGVIIAGATNTTYNANTSGSYSLIVTNACGVSATSSSIIVTINNPPNANISPAGTVNMCTGDVTTLTANTGADLVYQWRKNNVEIIGATSFSYAATANGNYTVAVTKTTTGCTKISKPTKVKITCKEGVDLEKVFFDAAIIYPNPSATEFTLQLNDDHFYDIQLCDISGKVLKTYSQVQGNLLMGNDLASGLYFVKLFFSQQQVQVIKLIKSE